MSRMQYLLDMDLLNSPNEIGTVSRTRTIYLNVVIFRPLWLVNQKRGI